MREAGHEVAYLTCDSDLPTCYSRELRPTRPGWLHCTTCRAGGIRSFTKENVSSLGDLGPVPCEEPSVAKDWAKSSASTLGRFESDGDYEGTEFEELTNRLAPAAAIAYSAARRWIERERLDGLCLFNGRMDATRGILEAAHDAGVPFVSMERTWFGHGLQLFPQESCSGLAAIDDMVAAWRNVPLSAQQARRAASHVAARFLRRNVTEWRAYNVNARATPWPVGGSRHRILLTPGSRNESWGHPDWQSRWGEATSGFDAVIEHLGLRSDDLVLRCHPNWGESIGARDGRHSERYFSEWAKKRGIHLIGSTHPTSTLGLIEQADAIVLSGGSAALEAGILGKQVIALGPSSYRNAGFQSGVGTPEELEKLTLLHEREPTQHSRESESIARQTLRYCHTMAYRVAQLVPYVRAVTTTRYEYFKGADPNRLIRIFRSRQLEADDPEGSACANGEAEVLTKVQARDWEHLVDASNPAPGRVFAVKRRLIYRSLDRTREFLPRGDL